MGTKTAQSAGVQVLRFFQSLMQVIDREKLPAVVTQLESFMLLMA
jgi:hypothetical protein